MPGKYRAYPEYKDSGVEWLGEIPNHWQIAELKRYSFVKGGYAFSSDSFIEDGEPVIRISDIKQDGSVSLKNCKCVSGELANKYSEFSVSSGELVMAMTGATIGKAGWFRGGKPALVNQRVGVFKCNDRYLDYRFFWYLLSSCGYQEHIQLTAFGGAQPNISDAGMVGYKTAIPAIEEQEKIANFLDHETAKINTLIEKQQQLIQLLKEKRLAVISHAVTKGLNPNAPMRDSGVEWLGEVPEHWKVISLKRLARKITDGEHISPTFTDEGMPFLSAKDIRDRTIDYEVNKYVTLEDGYRFRRRCNPEVDDILIVSRGATIGRVGLVERKIIFCLLGSVILLKPKTTTVDPVFVYYLLNQYSAKEQFFLASQASAQQAIYLVDVAELLIALPSLPEQIEIRNHLEGQIKKIDNLIQVSEKAIKLIQERRTALISAAVTGKIDVRSWQSPEPFYNYKETNMEAIA
ncbi:restriction endonuclease subunit S [Methylobacter svalbardensis]|uniref:restriction endonuclease subunit S n=1 Tax=Methylobacter svalbardensis TaxID=3080016 RepID=UPI0030EC9E61